MTKKRSKSVEDLLNMIDQKKTELDARWPTALLPWPAEEFIAEYIFNSNAIEGNLLTLNETKMVLQGQSLPHMTAKNLMEVIGHKQAFDFVIDLVKNKTPMTEDIIKKIHYLLLADRDNDRGIYRKNQVYIPGAAHTPSAPELIGQQMKELLATYAKSTAHIVTRQALFHIAYEAIHPFRDGNGRSGRLLLNLELMKKGFPPISIKFSDRFRYYNAFTFFHTQYDISAMEAILAHSLNFELDRYLLGDE